MSHNRTRCFWTPNCSRPVAAAVCDVITLWQSLLLATQMMLLLLCNHLPHLLHMLLCCCHLCLCLVEPLRIIVLHRLRCFVNIAGQRLLAPDGVSPAAGLSKLLVKLGKLKCGVKDTLMDTAVTDTSVASGLHSSTMRVRHVNHHLLHYSHLLLHGDHNLVVL